MVSPVSAIPAVVKGIGGLFGLFGGDGGDKKAREAEEKALQLLGGVGLPSLEELRLNPEMYQYLGDLVAEQEQAQTLSPSQMAQIAISPELKQQQLQALAKLQERGEAGLTASEKATLNEMRRQSQGAEQSRQQAILQSMEQRGAGGSGAELAARLLSSQAEANRASSEGDRLAAMAEERALQSILQGGQLAGQVRQQEFGEKADVARAADEIAKFNLQNQQEIQRRNIEREMQARARNLETRQSLGQSNVGLRNVSAEDYRNQLAKDYERRLQQAQDQAQVYRERAARYDKKSGQPSNLSKGIGMVGETLETILKPSDEKKNLPGYQVVGK